MGFNYNLQKIDDYRKKNPKQLLLGTETSSERSVRDVYSTDKTRNWMSSYDELRPDSTLDLARAWWKFYADRPWLSGGFAWTGFDYRGEPSPYSWPTISSYFGMVDMCGFPKDSFFYYKAWWRDEPVLHLYPHWNWAGREGEEVRIQVESNLDSVELFLNGRSLGTKNIEIPYTLEWKVKYAPGVLEARGTKDGKLVAVAKRETAGEPARIVLTADRNKIAADGRDIAMVRVEVVDEEGRTVPIADNLVQFKVSGEGTLIGVGNGDPNCLEADKGDQRSLFNGLAQAIVQATKAPGSISIEASSKKLGPARLTLSTSRVKLCPEVL
jgi:beta-galactosidase